VQKRKKLLSRFRLDWPLLGKELLEQSAQKRMYVMRVAYALVLFGAFTIYYIRHLGGGPVLALGGGYEPFKFLVYAQLVAIFLFLPPMMAGAIAQEKERDTLGLLFLTDLTPWELTLQKYVGRLIPMLTLLLLSLPLLAVTYSLGGVSFGMLTSNAVTLFLTCLVVGALALECSAHEATTFQALVRCWGLCFLFVTCCTFGLPGILLSTVGGGFGPGASGFALIFHLFFTGIINGMATLVFLVRAKQNLEPRAFIVRRNPFGHQFKQLDQYWKDLRKLVRGLLRKRDKEAHAIADELVRQQLGKLGDQREWSIGGYLLARMQVPTLLAFAIIIGFIVLLFVFITVLMDPKSTPFLFLVSGFWILALLTVPILSANAIASERINERLGAILTTPLTSREILDEWLGPVQRWIGFLVKPMLALILMDAVVKFKTQDTDQPRWLNVTVYLSISLLTIWIYPRVVQWCCLFLGLRIRNQIRAMMTAFFLVTGWCILPLVISNFVAQSRLLPGVWSGLLSFISPVYVIVIAEKIGVAKSDIRVTGDACFVIAAHFALLALIWWWVRHICLTKTDRYLGRV
jgi:ABC-type transport system involved in multi-copper enzyme maturation permease subunit